MANAHRPTVNQRLYFCRLHLQLLQQQLAEQQLPKAVIEQALGESTVLHLVLAYRAYLLEIALAYSVDLHAPDSAGQLVAALSEAGLESAEAQELLAMEAAGQWLGLLLQLYKKLGPLQPVVRSRASDTLISAAESDPGPSFDLAILQGFFAALTDIIDNQRARLEEW